MINILRGIPFNLAGPWRQVAIVMFDAVALIFALWLSYSLRLSTTFVPNGTQLALMALAPLVALPIFAQLGLYRVVIRHLNDRVVWDITIATGLSAILWLAILFLAEVTRIGVLPRSIPVIYWLLATVLIVGSRLMAKSFFFSTNRRTARDGEVLIYGAGAAGAQLASALRDTHGRRFVAALIDDNRQLHGRSVAGLTVYSPDDIDNLISRFGSKEIFLSMPSVSMARRLEILSDLSQHPVKIRALPAVSELVSGKYLVNQLQDIEVEDLLGRSAIPPDPELLRSIVSEKVLLVSGAGGSIGSELTRRIVKYSPRKLILLEANEFALYQIERELVGGNQIQIVPILGSVTDDVLVRRTLHNHGVQVVFHAAAHKHVPLVEANALEGVRNNVLGTEIISKAAYDFGVENFVLISTDKAVRPTNVMGATKRWAEFIVANRASHAQASGGHQKFCTVRFGNVLGSNGSVVPLFKEQIARGGPVTLTDERMTRYFMSIHEAAELIVQAGALSHGGDVFLLEMGEPVHIRHLAEKIINLAGLTVRSPEFPQGDIEISTVGLRPGEKLYEELFYNPSDVVRTRHPKILRGAGGDRPLQDVEGALQRLKEALQEQNEPQVRSILFEFIAE